MSYLDEDQQIHYEIGDRVTTPYGPGSVAGFERFERGGNTAPMADHDDRQHRIAVALDPGHTWAFDGWGPCYLWHKEIEPCATS